MYSRLFILFATIMALAVFATANPVPNPAGAVVRKSLKQFDIKRAIADAKMRRGDDDDEHKYKPSKYVLLTQLLTSGQGNAEDGR